MNKQANNIPKGFLQLYCDKIIAILYPSKVLNTSNTKHSTYFKTTKGYRGISGLY